MDDKKIEIVKIYPICVVYILTMLLNHVFDLARY